VAEKREIEFVFEPQEEGGFYVYAPDLPGLHTEGDDLNEAVVNAEEALALYVEGLRDDGQSFPQGVIRRRLTFTA
jgi:predicted RNase H-like HicB family nuclease